MKVELLSMEKKWAFLLVDSREVDGGIEVGIALSMREIKLLVSYFVVELA
ncbi:hypothetical protein HPP92_020210 [Vanilla planifolia]|uniref:Uncharacterized protein n=1 Tax=Vanilla planifolia TaxID=51239 RepID=A0A835UNN0_VANPL|nr:hypothetical protein HPP92_020561 [Vanilla planifolia]KAG0466046.1 hypothetical protein HPP92_020210 [Vanilla planifolia]